jgi:hypothetical protein
MRLRQPSVLEAINEMGAPVDTKEFDSSTLLTMLLWTIGIKNLISALSV